MLVAPTWEVHHVAGLEVPVHHAVLVQVLHSRHQLVEDVNLAAAAGAAAEAAGTGSAYKITCRALKPWTASDKCLICLAYVQGMQLRDCR
jgi:hypothetical protein